MSVSTRWALAGIVSGIAAACGSNATGPNLPVIVGTWTVTKWEYVSLANPSTKVDFIAQGNSGTMVFTATALTITSQGTTLITCTYTETATTLTATCQEPGGTTETLTFALALSGNTLNLTGGTTTYDFGIGEVPAYFNIRATKQ